MPKNLDLWYGGEWHKPQAGYADTKRMIARAPWEAAVDPMDGVVIHDPLDRPAAQTPQRRGEPAAHRPGQGRGEGRLADARHILDEEMSARHHAGDGQ